MPNGQIKSFAHAKETLSHCVQRRKCAYISTLRCTWFVVAAVGIVVVGGGWQVN